MLAFKQMKIESVILAQSTCYWKKKRNGRKEKKKEKKNNTQHRQKIEIANYALHLLSPVHNRTRERCTKRIKADSELSVRLN